MIPNDFAVVQAVHASKHYDLGSHAGQTEFVEDVVLALHKKDPRWGHLKKNPGQTQINGHAEDAVLYLVDPADGLCQSVDFIAGAGSPNARPAWQLDQPRYQPSDWFAPSPTDGGHVVPKPKPPVIPAPPQPTRKPYPGDQAFVDKLGRALADDYGARPQTLDAGSVMWAARVIWDYANTEGMDLDAAIKKHRTGPNGWRAALGLPPNP